MYCDGNPSYFTLVTECAIWFISAVRRQRTVIIAVINAGIWEEHWRVIVGERGNDYLMEVCPMCFSKAEMKRDKDFNRGTEST